MTTETTQGVSVELRDLSVRYGRTHALDCATAVIRPGTITGLLGPNGSGKTTLASVLAGFRRATSGTVLVAGRAPFEDPACAAATCLIREAGDVISDEKIDRTLRLHAALRPTWDDALARRLLDRFEVSVKAKPPKLSRGKRSVLGATIGLASRAPLTILDEIHLGMDAETRYAFYEELLADYAAHPRTIILSSHLIGELESLLEDVVVLSAGRVVAATSVEDLRSRLTTLVGPAAEVDRLVGARPVLSTKDLGATRQVTFDDAGAALDPALLAGAPSVQAVPVPLQDAVVHLTSRLRGRDAHDAHNTRDADDAGAHAPGAPDALDPWAAEENGALR